MTEAGKLQVPAEVLKRTTKCQLAFSCLETGMCGDRELCAVEYIGGEKLIFLKDRTNRTCPYRMPFGERQMCCCPVRAYLPTGLLISTGDTHVDAKEPLTPWWKR